MQKIWRAIRVALVALLVATWTIVAQPLWAKTSIVDTYSRDQLRSGFDACVDQFPNRQPIDLGTVASQWRVVALCSDDFAVVYSGRSKTPLLVVERLSRDSLIQAQAIKRTNNFFPDTRAKRKDRAELRDYKGSGFDRGHMAPAADRSSRRSMLQSFALSNMVPQHPINNRKIWNKLEEDTRKYVMRAKGDVFVFSGPLFESLPAKTMGKGGIWVPTHLFKLVLDPSAGKSWAHLVTNDGARYQGPPLSYEQFIKRTGWRVLPR